MEQPVYQIVVGVLAIIASLVAVIKALVSRRSNGSSRSDRSSSRSGAYSGPERRAELVTIQAEIANLKAAADRHSAKLEEMRRDIQNRFDRHAEEERRNDTQTAREIGELIGAVNALQGTVSRALRVGGVRTSPPGGVGLADDS